MRAKEPFWISLEQRGVAGPLAIEVEPVRQEPPDQCALPRLPGAEDKDGREDSKEPVERITRAPRHVLHDLDIMSMTQNIQGIPWAVRSVGTRSYSPMSPLFQPPIRGRTSQFARPCFVPSGHHGLAAVGA